MSRHVEKRKNERKKGKRSIADGSVRLLAGQSGEHSQGRETKAGRGDSALGGSHPALRGNGERRGQSEKR